MIVLCSIVLLFLSCFAGVCTIAYGMVLQDTPEVPENYTQRQRLACWAGGFALASVSLAFIAGVIL